MDCNPARTKDPVAWLETCPDFSQPLAALAGRRKWAQRKDVGGNDRGQARDVA